MAGGTMTRTVNNDKEVSYGNMEVSEWLFHLLPPYGYGEEIERFWRPWFASGHCLNEPYSVPELFCTAPKGWLIARSNAVSILPSILSLNGENGINRKESTACKTAHGPVGRRLFPPQQQHKIVALATQVPQEQGHPITHWSISDLARATIQKEIVDSIGLSTVWRLLDQAAIKPHRWHYWLNSSDPDFQIKMQDVVHLYLHALEMYQRDEIIVSVDEKTSIQALQRMYPTLQTKVGSIARMEHEYIRHGTCCLTAGLEVATGSIMGMLTANRPAEVFAEFMAWVCDYYADARKIHIVLDNLNTHYHEQTCQVVAQACKCKLGETKKGCHRKHFLSLPEKRVVFHFTPSHASWLNQIEIWFSTLTRKIIRRGDFSSVADLESKIVEFIKYYNKYLAKPYQWTYTGKPLAAFRKVA